MTWRRGPALVTGAASGMGRELSLRLASEGICVAAVDVDESGLGLTARRAPTVVPIVCDVTDRGTLGTALDEFEREHGPLETLAPAAAIAPAGYLLDQDPATLGRAMDVNYMGVVNSVHAVLPRMLARGKGDVVLFGSLAAWVPSFRTGAYSATKAAVVALAETLQAELAHTAPSADVRIVCVCPSAVDTPLMEGVDFPDEVRSRISPTPVHRVLDDVERGLTHGEFFVFPRPARALLRARRAFPSLLWSLQRRIEPVQKGPA